MYFGVYYMMWMAIGGLMLALKWNNSTFIDSFITNWTNNINKLIVMFSISSDGLSVEMCTHLIKWTYVEPAFLWTLKVGWSQDSWGPSYV